MSNIIVAVTTSRSGSLAANSDQFKLLTRNGRSRETTLPPKAFVHDRRCTRIIVRTLYIQYNGLRKYRVRSQDDSRQSFYLDDIQYHHWQ